MRMSIPVAIRAVGRGTNRGVEKRRIYLLKCLNAIVLKTPQLDLFTHVLVFYVKLFQF